MDKKKRVVIRQGVIRGRKKKQGVNGGIEEEA